MLFNIFKSKELKVGKAIHQLHTVAGIIVGINPSITEESLNAALNHYIKMVECPRIITEAVVASIVDIYFE